jgi:hypothetical protein
MIPIIFAQPGSVALLLSFGVSLYMDFTSDTGYYLIQE